MNNEEFLKHLYPIMTTLESYIAFADCLRRRDMFFTFLVHGDMALVREVILTFHEESEQYVIDWMSKMRAIDLCLNESRYDRVINLLEAIRQCCEQVESRLGSVDPTFDGFVYSYVWDIDFHRDWMPLKRFFTICGQELAKNHQSIHEKFCFEFVQLLRFEFYKPLFQKLLVDITGQSFLLTSKIFVAAFLTNSCTSSSQEIFVLLCMERSC